jgi:DNA repair protein RecO (recombination protein O)
MMLIAGPALVLQTIRHGDQSVVARMFTRQRGLVSFLVKGVYARKSGKAAILQAMNLVHVAFRNRENRDLQMPTDLKMHHAYRNIPFSPVAVAQLVFISEVLIKTLRDLEPDDHLFDYVQGMLLALDDQSDVVADFHLRFLLDYSNFLGIRPQMNFSEEFPFFDPAAGEFIGFPRTGTWNKELSEQLAILMDLPFESLHLRKSNRYQRQQLTDHLLGYYKCHFPSLGEFKSPEVLSAVFE